jgi:23S rRNA (adenine2503-C2)-methyltransferase
MLSGVNDSSEHASELIDLLRRHSIRCKINLIPFNPFPASGLVRSPADRVAAFAAQLSAAKIVTTVRKTRGDDIDAACGQLAGEVMDRTGIDKRLQVRGRILLETSSPAARGVRSA